MQTECIECVFTTHENVITRQHAGIRVHLFAVHECFKVNAVMSSSAVWVLHNRYLRDGCSDQRSLAEQTQQILSDSKSQVLMPCGQLD